LSETGNVSVSAKKSGISRSDVYAERKQNEDFAAAWREAEHEAKEALISEARRRATEGYEEPIVYAGKVVVDPQTGDVIVKKKYSDSLMMFLIKNQNMCDVSVDESAGSHIKIVISEDESNL